MNLGPVASVGDPASSQNKRLNKLQIQLNNDRNNKQNIFGLGVHGRKAELRGIEGPPGMEPATSFDIPIA